MSGCKTRRQLRLVAVIPASKLTTGEPAPRCLCEAWFPRLFIGGPGRRAGVAHPGEETRRNLVEKNFRGAEQGGVLAEIGTNGAVKSV